MTTEAPVIELDEDGTLRRVLKTLMAHHGIEGGLRAQVLVGVLGISQTSAHGRISGAKYAGGYKWREARRLAEAFGVPLRWFDEGIDGEIPPLPPGSVVERVRRQGLEPRTRCFGGHEPAEVLTGGRDASEPDRARQQPLLHLVPPVEVAAVTLAG